MKSSALIFDVKVLQTLDDICCSKCHCLICPGLKLGLIEDNCVISLDFEKEYNFQQTFTSCMMPETSFYQVE